ncbi:class I SAM-dependent methyltransferase [Solicola gregarius]|uniref:Class I SAM-dependent methyltransferase n=1 Tax=Solicola gregarius TaxID=2908642 RepID=A0AA46TEH7_9ACTN|nr:class I SAM-dependent methyltransferase [Solicola gregarius]UYM03379.1 class I SAM-dependent methyltransferase [Solicola gregarius]
MIDDRTAAELRDALLEADFTPQSVGELLGTPAHRALLRNETTPALRATGDGSALSTLTRLFSLQRPVDATAADHALPGLVDRLCLAGMLERTVSEVRARVDVRPYGDEEHDWWVVCDLTPGLDGADRAVPTDHVLGISEASMTLAQLTIRDSVDSALDLGAGCGVQSLHLGTHAGRVVGTDVNQRALSMARATARINGIEVDVRDGSLFTPVEGEQFDLIVTNPPFVISPGTGERLVYRDSGMPGDELVRRLVTDAPAYLRPGGWLQLLGNWAHRGGRSWDDRLEEWLDDTGCDAWVLQREVVDLPTYVELWLADAGLHGTPQYRERYDTWLSWFDDEGIEAVGFGWMCLQRTDRDQPVVRLEDWPAAIEQPVAPQVSAWSRAVDESAAPDDEVLGMRLRQRELVQEQQSAPGADDPERIVVRQLHGFRRARQVDTVTAGLIGACDGELSVGQILDALAQILDRDSVELRAAYADDVRSLLMDGYLTADLR